MDLDADLDALASKRLKDAQRLLSRYFSRSLYGLTDSLSLSLCYLCLRGCARSLVCRVRVARRQFSNGFTATTIGCRRFLRDATATRRLDVKVERLLVFL